MGIPCAFCGMPIAVGDAITLYRKEPTHVPPEEAVCFDGDVYVGCMCCAMTPFDRRGTWLPDEEAQKMTGEPTGHVVQFTPSTAMLAVAENVVEALKKGGIGGFIALGGGQIFSLDDLPQEFLDQLPPEFRPPQGDKEVP